jgi:hypothetical protein
VHRTAHDYIVLNDFVKENMLVKGAENQKETPVSQSWMKGADARAKLRMLFKKSQGGFNRIEITFRNFQICFKSIPLKLLLNIGDKFVRPADVHKL